MLKGAAKAGGVFAGMLAFVLLISGARSTSESYYYVADIDSIGYEALSTMKQRTHVRWWVEAGDKLLVLAGEGFEHQTNTSVKRLDIIPKLHRLYIVQRGHSANIEGIDADLLLAGGRKMVIQSRSDAVPVLKDLHIHSGDAAEWRAAHARLLIFEPNQIFARQVENEPGTKLKHDWRMGVREAVEAVDGRRWYADVEFLASLNRHSSQEGVTVARDWLATQFEVLGYEVSLQPFKLGSRTLHNVIAKIEGRSRPDDVYIVGGHYDSTSENYRVAAPGAEDNATGAAGVLEMARVFALNPPSATVYFIAFSGEEQGLIGSKHHVAQLVADDMHGKIKGVINMDMIGYSADPDDTLEVLLETEPFASELMYTLKAAAAEYTDLRVYTTFDAWGSDHVPYLNRKIPAVLTIDNDYGSYPAYHRTTDTPEKVVVAMGVGILKMNVAALAEIAN